MSESVCRRGLHPDRDEARRLRHTPSDCPIARMVGERMAAVLGGCRSRRQPARFAACCGSLVDTPSSGQGIRGVVMKFIVQWTTRPGSEPDDNIDSSESLIKAFGTWTPPEEWTISEFVNRVDGRGGLLICETDDLASIDRTVAQYPRGSTTTSSLCWISQTASRTWSWGMRGPVPRVGSTDIGNPDWQFGHAMISSCRSGEVASCVRS